MKKELVLFLFICTAIFLFVFQSDLRKQTTTSISKITLQDSFEKLEGLETDDWNYIQTKSDFNDLEKFKALYKKNIQHQFNGSPIFKIPKIIHLIWIGPRPFPIESVETCRTWIAHHPDWTFIFWTDRRRPAPCRGMEVRTLDNFNFLFLKERYDASKNWGEKSDIWRQEILYQEGGIYIDHDARCLRPFHRLNSGYDFYAGLEMPHEEIEDHAITAGIGIIGARPHHPVIKRTIELIDERWDEVTKNFSSTDPLAQVRQVAHRTYIAMTYAFKDHLNLPGNTDIVFPASYFYPKHGLPGFYSEHLYGTTWNGLAESPYEQLFKKMIRLIRSRDSKIIRLELFSLLAITLSFMIYVLILIKGKKKL